MRVSRLLLLVLSLGLLAGCDSEPVEDDAGPPVGVDAGPPGAVDAGPPGASDAGPGPGDAGPGGSDAGPPASSHPVWVAVGNWGFRAATEDGMTWATTMNPSTGNDHSPDLLRDVSWGNGYFVAVGGDANAMVMRSTDGVTWEEDLHPSGDGQWKGGVAFGGGRWVAVGGVGTTIVSEDDGASWRAGAMRLPSAGRNIAYGDGRFVAVGDGGTIAVSTDGDMWTDRSVGGIRLDGVAYGAGVWAVTGSNWNGSGFDTACFTSTDAETWVPCGFSASRFDAVIATGGALIITHGEGYEQTTDGTTWTRSTVRVPSEVFEAAGTWVGVSGDRTYRGPALESLTQGDDLPRGTRAFTMGWVAD